MLGERTLRLAMRFQTLISSYTMTQQNVSYFVEENLVRKNSDRRDGHRATDRISLAIAVGMTEGNAIDGKRSQCLCFRPFRQFRRLIRLSFGLRQDKPVRLVLEHSDTDWLRRIR